MPRSHTFQTHLAVKGGGRGTGGGQGAPVPVLLVTGHHVAAQVGAEGDGGAAHHQQVLAAACQAVRDAGLGGGGGARQPLPLPRRQAEAPHLPGRRWEGELVRKDDE